MEGSNLSETTDAVDADVDADMDEDPAAEEDPEPVAAEEAELLAGCWEEGAAGEEEDPEGEMIAGREESGSEGTMASVVGSSLSSETPTPTATMNIKSAAATTTIDIIGDFLARCGLRREASEPAMKRITSYY